MAGRRNLVRPLLRLGDLGENIAASLAKGAAVVATGRLRARTWQADDGTKRAAVEMTVDDLGPSLRRALAKVTKATREHPNGNGAAPGQAADQWATPGPATPVPAAAVRPRRVARVSRRSSPI